MKLAVDIRRFDSETGAAPFVQRYAVEAEETDRFLDVLIRIRSGLDPSLSFRSSCAHGVCGSDAMRINGKERLACKTLVRDLAATGSADAGGPAAGAPTEPLVVTVEPLRHLQVLRDLVVDQGVFFQRSALVTPYLMPAAAPTDREMLQSPQQQEQFEDATKCINCAACFSACPVLEKNPRFLGPAAIVAAARFVEDSRDWGLAPRLDALDTPDGVWGCENHFECTRVCPREIKVTKLINLMKRRVSKERERRGEVVHDGAAKGTAQ
jgi:succinate dehydrogenase / fumarate reductase, iron-sulfur subunit